MDRLMGIALVVLSAAVLVLLWKLRRMRRETEGFAEKVEQALDAIVSGREWDREEGLEDSLWSRTGVQLAKAEHVMERRAAETVRERERVKGLISDISHQTRMPMANIKLYLEFLQEESLSAQGQAFLGKLEGQTEKLDFFLQSMVKMSRLETGILQIQKERADLWETIRRAISAVVPAAAKKQIDLFAVCEEPVMLCHDRKWTEEAIYNVLDNAVKYTPAGGRISVETERQEWFLNIKITDTGKGIPLERQAEIFTRFYREPEVHDLPGVGIGLYLTRTILELQNGYVEVRSQTGRGACFCLYLPEQA